MAVLETWMTKKRLDDEALASKLNISRAHASRLRRRKCLPSRDLALELERVTRIPAAKFMLDERAA